MHPCAAVFCRTLKTSPYVLIGKNTLAADVARVLPLQDTVKTLAQSQMSSLYTLEIFSKVAQNVVDSLWKKRALLDFVNLQSQSITFVDVLSSRTHHLRNLDGGLCSVVTLASSLPPTTFKPM